MENRITNSGAGSAPKYNANAGGRKKKEVKGKGVKSKIPDWVEEKIDKQDFRVHHEMRLLIKLEL